MTKGTYARGKMSKRTHVLCRRCGERSYHASHKECAHCGFGKTTTLRRYAWGRKINGKRKVIPG